MKLYALIMAGGEGKRFWPLSSTERPKQFLPLIDERSMIRCTYDRIVPLIPRERIIVITTAQYADRTRTELPDVPETNIIIEPQGKNTAPCIAYGTLFIEARDKDAVVVVLPADHAIKDEKRFREVLGFAADVAAQKIAKGHKPLVTLGITPTSPETGYGYIKALPKKLLESGSKAVHMVERFTEKPGIDSAREYLREGNYYWNSGIFVWQASSILAEFKSLLPEWYRELESLSKKIMTDLENEGAKQFYDLVQSGPIDVLILEKSKNTVVIPVEFGWSDLGSWDALDNYLRQDGGEDIVRGNVELYGTESNLVISSRKPVAVLGVRGLVIVDTENGLLVLNKENSQDLKAVVDRVAGKRREDRE